MLGFNRMHKKETGDTLIEVLFAMTVFSFIVVTALSLMNQGVAAAQRSLEITTVRQQMDGQAETLRFLHQSYVESFQVGQTFNLTDTLSTPAEEYYRIIQHLKDPLTGNRQSVSAFFGPAPCAVPSDPNTDFIMNPIFAKLAPAASRPTLFKKATTYSQITYSTGNTLSESQGLWIEALRSPGSGTAPGYIDFHIRACWNVSGSDLPMKLGTIVRLYEPRG